MTMTILPTLISSGGDCGNGHMSCGTRNDWIGGAFSGLMRKVWQRQSLRFELPGTIDSLHVRDGVSEILGRSMICEVAERTCLALGVEINS
jgi:hypothetical protein